MPHAEKKQNDPFYTAYLGRFSSLLSWESLDAFWRVVRERADAGWYLYAIGMPPPTRPSTRAETEKFIAQVDALLHRDHHEDYCGIVYVDDKEDPSFIKIFDPHHLGVSCGFSHNPPLPGWIMTRMPPNLLEDKRKLPENRRRWWDALWE